MPEVKFVTGEEADLFLKIFKGEYIPEGWVKRNPVKVVVELMAEAMGNLPKNTEAQ